MHRTTRKRQAKGNNINVMISAPPLDQAALWNGPAGQAWIDSQMLLDELFAPFADHLAESIGLAGASRILDIGCGTGATPPAAARRLGWAGRAYRGRLSHPLLVLARARATTASPPPQFHTAAQPEYHFSQKADTNRHHTARKE